MAQHLRAQMRNTLSSAAELGRAYATAVGLALFPRQCLACTLELVDLGTLGLCGPCATGLVYNGGPRCHICDVPQTREPGGRAVCLECPARHNAFVRLRAPLVYAGVVRTLIAHGKFKLHPGIWPALARTLVEDAGVQQLASIAAAVVPVPLGSKRARARGYNPSTLLARNLARASARPLVHALRRVRQTPPQSSVDVGMRQRNVQGAFMAVHKLSGPVLLIDDIVTTGATVVQASLALQAAGAGPIFVAAVARTAR